MNVIPPQVSDLVNLYYLDFSSNALTGEIPSLSSLVKLERLDLSGNFLSGSISPLTGSLPNLVVLDLSNNSLVGTIPMEIWKAKGLVELLGAFHTIAAGRCKGRWSSGLPPSKSIPRILASVKLTQQESG